MFNINLHATAPVIKALKKPIAKTRKLMFSVNKLPPNISFNIFPNITGITIKNENLAASFFLFPKNIEVHMVAPDLEIPGIIEIACEIPIINE